MENFIKIAAIMIIAVILGIYTKKQSPEISVLLVIATVCSVLLFAISSYIEPVMEFISKIREMGELDHTAVTTLMKATGIGLLSEITVLLCVDAGFGSLGKMLQIISIFAILFISLPVINELISLITKVLMP